MVGPGPYPRVEDSAGPYVHLLCKVCCYAGRARVCGLQNSFFPPSILWYKYPWLAIGAWISPTFLFLPSLNHGTLGLSPLPWYVGAELRLVLYYSFINVTYLSRCPFGWHRYLSWGFSPNYVVWACHRHWAIWLQSWYVILTNKNVINTEELSAILINDPPIAPPIHNPPPPPLPMVISILEVDICKSCFISVIDIC